VTATSIQHVRRQASALVALLVACSSLAACGGGSSPPKEEQPILTEKSVVKVWKDYDKLNNAALIKAGPPTYDASAFAVVDTGPLLEQDITSVKLDRIDRESRSNSFTNTPSTLYAPVETAGFALSTLVLPKYKAWEDLTSIVRTGDPATWKQEMSIDVRVKDLPRPLDPGRESTASRADVERAREVVMRISEYWRTLRKPPGIALGVATSPEYVKITVKSRSGKFTGTSKIVVEGIPKTRGAGEALRVVRTQGGLLVLANVRLRNTLKTRGKTVLTHGGTLGKLYGTRPGKTSTLHWSSTLAISVPEKGSPRVVGASYVPMVK